MTYHFFFLLGISAAGRVVAGESSDFLHRLVYEWRSHLPAIVARDE